ncbi:MAG: aminopeptidase P family protein [Candidatus Heimdallarchaeota archaeon]|nr:MAG: aminopeptidase P family protein [Candidatus Heimdallarchaeota archaeon]
MDNSYTRIPLSEIEARISRLKSYLKKENIDGAILLSTPELYYYSGVGYDGAVYIPAMGDPVHLVKRNLELAKSFSQIPTVKMFGRKSKVFETLCIKQSAIIAIEMDTLSYSFVQFLQSKAKNVRLDNCSSILRRLRSVKSDYEINQIKSAASLVDRSFEHCTEIATPEMTEIELAVQLERWLLENGHDGFITTYGFNTELLHYAYVISSQSSVLNIHFTPISGYGLTLKYPYGPSRQKLGRKPFIVDTCGNNQGYISDTTRTFICGKFDVKTRDEINSLQEIKKFLYLNLKPSVNLGDLYNEVIDLSKELRIEDRFMGTTTDKVAFIGHGVGLELDELPVFYPKGPNLVAGNIIACEPKFFIQGKKVLGIEDTYAITESGNILLSKSPDYYEIST